MKITLQQLKDKANKILENGGKIILWGEKYNDLLLVDNRSARLMEVTPNGEINIHRNRNQIKMNDYIDKVEGELFFQYLKKKREIAQIMDFFNKDKIIIPHVEPLWVDFKIYPPKENKETENQTNFEVK